MKMNIGEIVCDKTANSNPQEETNKTGAEIRRMAHIKSEQKRRQNINDGFNELRQLLPFCHDVMDSKASILKKAVNYIKFLQMELSKCPQHHSQQQTQQQQQQHIYAPEIREEGLMQLANVSLNSPTLMPTPETTPKLSPEISSQPTQFVHLPPAVLPPTTTAGYRPLRIKESFQ